MPTTPESHTRHGAQPARAVHSAAPDGGDQPHTEDQSHTEDQGQPLVPEGGVPGPPPLDPPMVPFAVAGLVVWALVGLALLPFRDELAADGRGHWLTICLAGFLVGLPGLAVMIRHDANRRRRRG